MRFGVYGRAVEGHMLICALCVDRREGYVFIRGYCVGRGSGLIGEQCIHRWVDRRLGADRNVAG